MPPDRRKLLQDFYSKYAPDQQLTDERLKAIDTKYGEDNDALLKDLYSKYAPQEQLTPERIDAISTKYDLKKKESTSVSSPNFIERPKKSSNPLEIYQAPELLKIQNQQEQVSTLPNGLTEQQDKQKSLQELANTEIPEKAPAKDAGFWESLWSTIKSGISDQLPKEYATQRLRMSKGTLGDVFDPRSDINAFGDQLDKMGVSRDEFAKWNFKQSDKVKQAPGEEKAKLFLTQKFGAEGYDKIKKQLEENNMAERLGHEQEIQKQNQEAKDKTGNVVQDLRDIDSGQKLLSFLGNSVGQALYRMPTSLLTGTMGSIVAESSAIYDRQLDMIADATGKSREQLIKDGEDEPAAGQALAVMAGGLDAISAGGILGVFRKAASKQLTNSLLKELPKQFVKGGLFEGATEAAQGEIEEKAAANGANVSYIPDAWRMATGFAAGFAGGGGLSMVESIVNKYKNQQPLTQQQNASDIRSNPEQKPQGGDVTTGSENQSSQNIQLDEKQSSEKGQANGITEQPSQNTSEGNIQAAQPEQVKSSILNQDTDLKGAPKKPFMKTQGQQISETKMGSVAPKGEPFVERQSLIDALKKAKAPKKLIDSINPAAFHEYTGKIAGNGEGFAGGFFDPGKNGVVTNILGAIARGNDELVVHEAVHMATINNIEDYFKLKEGKSSLKELQDKGSTLSQEQVTHLDSINKEFEKAKTNWEKNKTPKHPYGYTNIQEFFSEFISNPDFRKQVGKDLNAGKTGVQKILTKIYDFLETFGIKIKNRTSEYLDKINSSIEKIYQGKNKVIEQAIREGQYDTAIDNGEMTAQDAKTIIESAGFKTPQSILDKIAQPNDQVQTPSVEPTKGGTESEIPKVIEEKSIQIPMEEKKQKKVTTKSKEKGKRKTGKRIPLQKTEEQTQSREGSEESGGTSSLDRTQEVRESEVSKSVEEGKEVEKPTPKKTPPPTVANETTEIKTDDEVTFEWLGADKAGKVISVSGNKIKIKSGKTIYNVDKSNVIKQKPDSEDDITNYNSKKNKPIGLVSTGTGFLFDTDLIDKMLSSAGKFFTKQFTSKGYLPKTVFDRWNKTKAEISKYESQIRFTIGDLRKTIGEEYGKKPTDAQITDMNSVLSGKQPKNPLPPKTAAMIQEMRAQIDNLSQRFINEGITAGDLTAKFTQNLGTYLTRSYRKYDDPFWSEFVPVQVKNKAMAFLRTKYPGYNQEEIQGLLNYLLYSPDAPMSVLKGSKLGSKDLSILQKKGDIAPEIRALMGEYGDPLLNYARSVTKMATMISKHHFLEDIRKDGMGKYLFDKPTGKYSVPIASEGSKTMAPLNGLYTTEDIAEAFNEFGKTDVNSKPIEYLMKFFGLIKAGKTVFSVMTHARNFFGNVGFVMMNGHWRLDKFGKAVQTAWANVYSTDKAIRDKLQEYIQLGIVQDSAVAGELRHIVEDIRGGKDFFEQMNDSRLKKAAKSVVNTSQNLYQFEDDLYKIFAFENELSRYQKAFPNLSAQEVKEKAAEIVRMTYPTYSLVPKIVKSLRANPFVGSFVSFPAEVIRTTYNTVALAKSELAAKETRSIGAQRLAGIMTALILPTATSLATRAFLGMDQDDDDSLRKFVAPWQKDSEFIYLNHADDKVTILDMGYSDPHSYLKRPFYAFMNEGNIPEAGLAMAVQILQPFLSEEMVLTAYEDVMRNQKKNGDQVYNKYAPIGDQMADIFKHVEGITQIGTIKSLQNLTKAVQGKTDRYGKKYDVEQELIALFTGQKTEIKDINQALLFKAYTIKDAIDQTNKEFNRVMKSKAPSPEEKAAALKRKNETMDNITKEAVDLYLAALRLGVNPKDAKSKMNLTKSTEIRKAISGQ